MSGGMNGAPVGPQPVAQITITLLQDGNIVSNAGGPAISLNTVNMMCESAKLDLRDKIKEAIKNPPIEVADPGLLNRLPKG